MLVRRAQDRGRRGRGLHVPAGEGLSLLRGVHSRRGSSSSTRRRSRPCARRSRASPSRRACSSPARRSCIRRRPRLRQPRPGNRTTSSRRRRRRTTRRCGSSRPAARGRRRRPCTGRTTRWSPSRATPGSVLGYDESDRVLPVPKLFFGYARDMTALFTFGVGAAGIVFPERTTPERIFELIERHRPTILVNVPTMMAQMLAHPGAERRRPLMPALVVSSGEALPAEVHRRFVERFGVEVLEGIGSSELYHIYVSNRPGRVRDRQRRTARAGLRGPDRRSRTATTSPTALPGELHVRGASMALRYEGDEERSTRTFAGRLGAHRRPVRAGRRRLPLVPRPRRRPAQGGWDLGRSARDRGLPARPSPGARVRGRRPRGGRAVSCLARSWSPRRRTTTWRRSRASSSATSAASSPRTRRRATCASWARSRRPRTARSTARRSARASSVP